MANLTRAEVVSSLASKTATDGASVERFLEALAELAGEEASSGFLIPNFGKFEVRPGRKFEYRNPATGTTMMVPGQPIVAFTPDFAFEQGVLAESPREPKANDLAKSPRLLPTIRLTPSADDIAAVGIELTRETQNKMGGTPDWIQGEPRPVTCCGSEMTFYGQFDSQIGGEFNIVDCGIIYVFLCDACSKTNSLVQYY